MHFAAQPKRVNTTCYDRSNELNRAVVSAPWHYISFHFEVFKHKKGNLLKEIRVFNIFVSLCFTRVEK